MKKIAVFSVLILFMVFASGAQAFIITQKPTYISFLQSFPPGWVQVENFEDTTFIPGFSITEVGGAGTINFGVYNNIVDDSPLRYQVFNYAPGMFGFGGFFDLTPGGPGKGIDVYVNDNNMFALSVPNTASGEWYGFITDTLFYGVKFLAGSQSGIQETYYYVDAHIAPVPIPAPILLLGAGLMGLVGLRKRLNK